jgi:glycosyltransferase involved in cell wall biosynthesis
MTVLGINRVPRVVVEEDQGVRIIRLPHARLRCSGMFAHRWRLRRALAQVHAEAPIDVLESPEMGMALVGRWLHVPKIVRLNGGHHFFCSTLGQRTRRWSGWLERHSLDCADFLCAVSRYVADTTRRLLRLDGRPIEVLPNPVDVARFAPISSIPEEEGLIVFAGTVTEKKGVANLIAALPEIVRRVPAARLLIAGRDTTDPVEGGSYTARLQRSIPAECKDHVEFLGSVPHTELPEVLARASVCVYPSHMEAMPLTWLEGLAMGKAVVGSRIGPAPEVIEDEVTGLLCTPHDPSAIADSVVRVLKDPALRMRLGAQARDRAVKLFSIDRLIAANEAFYSRCLEQYARA